MFLYLILQSSSHSKQCFKSLSIEQARFSHQSLSGQSPSQPEHVTFSEQRQQASPHLAIPNFLFITVHFSHFFCIFHWHSLHFASWIEIIPPHFGQINFSFCFSMNTSTPCACTMRLFSIRLAWYLVL